MDIANRLRQSAKKALVEATHLTRVSHLLSPKFGGRGCVLMYHEITQDACDRLGQGCTIDCFEKTLAQITRRGFDFVSLAEAKRRLRDHKAKPFVAITFDDGYRDNIDLALPVLEKYQAPATIFVPSDIATRKINAWWLGIRELVAQNEKLFFEPMRAAFSCVSLSEKQAAYQTIIDWVWQDFTRAACLQPTFESYGVELSSLVEKLCLNEKHIADADKHELIEIGAHTVTHRALSTLSDEEVLNEFIENKKWLEALLGRQVLHFAYPYGRPAIEGAREAKLAEAAGFDIALTTDPACLFAEHYDQSLLWPRVNGEFVGSVASGVSWAVHGTWPAFKSRLRSAKVNLADGEAWS